VILPALSVYGVPFSMNYPILIGNLHLTVSIACASLEVLHPGGIGKAELASGV